MWFKQICFYPLAADKMPDTQTLADKLAAAAFVPVQGLDWFSEGFAAPQGFSPEPVFSADLTDSFALKKEERVLPAAVIREMLDERVAQIQDSEGRTVGKKEKQELKEQITDDLLPRAFTRSSRTLAVLDRKNGFLLVNQASAAKAENLLLKLREALGGLEARLPKTAQSPSALMTQWLQNGAAQGGFELGSDCEIKGAGDVVPTVKITNADLTSDEVVQHIKNGKTVTQLGLVWREQIAFVLTQDFALKRIQYLDTVQEEAEQYGDDAPALAFASQLLMAESLGAILHELAAHLGGWQE
ncbi:recombination-associated protein RdgC [Neisseria leonii]|uniref:Recombination-associated protein RdgC n=1 Tax=Neisseria leonii TaxID=2995413 RepID=A0A9X4E2V7_9NEIS|nr:recombination-associated protein RdgC [Neisseria sp. 51.81]MDD9327720.1 recombination-associated protein RdgC [Neisseria sp. 51.81]